VSGGAPRLAMRGIAKHFLGVQALSDVELTVDAGEVLALVGENGAGKSTLIKILSGAHTPDAGEVLVDGERVDITTPADAEALGIATVYQELNLFPALSVAENLLFGRYPRRGVGIDWKAMRAEARRFLGELNVDLDVERRVGELSIAERQMLEIAKALHREVRVLVLDEPTAVLGGDDVDRLLDLVRSLRGHGVAVIFISHRLEEIFGLADRYVVLKDGRQVGDGLIAETDADGLVKLMVGRDVRVLPRDPVVRDDVLLRATGIARDGVLHDIDLTLHRGEVLGIAGLRGAGRTELARAIFGADPIDAGTVEVEGREVSIRSPRDAVAAGIGLVPEDRAHQGLFRALSTARNIPVVKLAAGGERQVVPSAERRTAEGYVGTLNIRLPDVDAPVATLSGGNQQKVVLAKWLEAGVSVLILDEPTRGIDIGSKQEIYELIRELCERGLGVILISSELPEVLQLSDRILVMQQGRVAAELDAQTATEETIMGHAVGAGVAARG
jgi:ABC-type sugar transport system ATPase subunit